MSASVRRSSIVRAACACVLVAWPCDGGAQALDRVLAVVSGQVILASDVRAFLGLGLLAADDADPAVREQVALSRLIERRLVLDEIDRYVLAEPPPERVERDLATVRARFDTEEAFTALLAAVGFDLDDLRQILRDDARRDAYLADRFGVAARFTEAELRAYYDANRGRFVEHGEPVSFAAARDDVEDRLWTERRAEREKAWIAGLLRRADILRVDR